MDFKSFMNIVDGRVDAVMEAGAGSLGVDRTLIESGSGKHIRPRMVFECASALDGNMERCADLAAAAEMLHLASLCHDDVIDGAETRRGRPSLNARIGNQKAILFGDFIHASSALLAAQRLGQEISTYLASTVVRMCASELMEARLRWNAGATLDLYMQVIDGKTAALFEACACGAAMLSTDDVAAREAFKKFGLSFGMSFQILDDILDYFTDAEAWGKEPLKDLKEGLVTLPLIMALGNGNNTGREAAIDYLRTSGASPLDIPAVSKFVSGSGAVERCSEMALSFIRQGVSSLGAHADSSGLKAFAEESLKRRF